MSCSCRLSDGMSTSAAVRVTTSADRSRAMTPLSHASRGSEHAELVALGVGHDGPSDLAVRLAQDTGTDRSQVVDRAAGLEGDVPVHAILDGLRLGNGAEVEALPRAPGDVLERVTVVLRVVRQAAAEHVSPPARHRPAVGG